MTIDDSQIVNETIEGGNKNSLDSQIVNETIEGGNKNSLYEYISYLIFSSDMNKSQEFLFNKFIN